MAGPYPDDQGATGGAIPVRLVNAAGDTFYTASGGGGGGGAVNGPDATGDAPTLPPVFVSGVDPSGNIAPLQVDGTGALITSGGGGGGGGGLTGYSNTFFPNTGHLTYITGDAVGGAETCSFIATNPGGGALQSLTIGSTTDLLACDLDVFFFDGPVPFQVDGFPVAIDGTGMQRLLGIVHITGATDWVNTGDPSGGASPGSACTKQFNFPFYLNTGGGVNIGILMAARSSFVLTSGGSLTCRLGGLR